MESSHPLHDVISSQESSRGVNNIPKTESLKDLIEQRTVPFWIQEVEPLILGNLYMYYCTIVNR